MCRIRPEYGGASRMADGGGARQLRTSQTVKEHSYQLSVFLWWIENAVQAIMPLICLPLDWPVNCSTFREAAPKRKRTCNIMAGLYLTCQTLVLCLSATSGSGCEHKWSGYRDGLISEIKATWWQGLPSLELHTDFKPQLKISLKSTTSHLRLKASQEEKES